MEQYDNTHLPVHLDILSFLLNITVPGQYTASMPCDALFPAIHCQLNKMFESLELKGWDIRRMGSIPDGLYIPPGNQSEVAELTSTVEISTDYDTWISRPELPIGFIPTSAPLIADTSGCPPGYARVKLNKTDSVEQMISTYPVDTILTQTVADGETFIQFKDLLSNFEFAVNDPENYTAMMHGPAINICERYTDISVDFVPVLICSEWPELGHRWERRQRRSGWPSPEFISELKKLGCDFVQVPSHNSTNPEVEWRIAFSLIEQKLCQSFTTVQKQCFLISKMIMKRNLKSCEGYSTYLLKNCMFWMMEDIALTDWQEDNALVRYIILLLETFQCYLEKGNLPHYVIEERNLIGHIDNYTHEEMIEKTDVVCHSLHTQILLHCAALCPLRMVYVIHREHCLSLFQTTLKYTPDVRLSMKREILIIMVILLAIERKMELLVNTLKQHGHLLDRLALHPDSTISDEKAWIFEKVDRILMDCKSPQNFLSPRLSGMLCLYYYHLTKDESLLKSAFDHFTDALNNFGDIYVDGKYFIIPSQPDLYILQVLAFKAMGHYQQALDIIIRYVTNEDEWKENKILCMAIPSEAFGLVDTLIEGRFWDYMLPCVYDPSDKVLT